jgi:transposase InsO family protein
VQVQRVMTDSGPAYISFVHKLACAALGLKHIRTRPYRPRTNGKAERFIRTLLGGWAYGAIYAAQRTIRLARGVQLATTTRLPQPQATRNSPTRAEQPPRV